MMKYTMKIEVIVGILAITWLETFAIVNEIDGAILNVVIAIIAGLCGYEIKNHMTHKEKD